MAGTFGGGDDDVISGINVTPLVDVVLVLLVIFLITAPVIYQSAIKVQLPKASSGDPSQSQSPLSFTLTKDGQLLWNQEKVEWAAVDPRVAELVKKSTNPDELTALISADEATPHGIVVRLMDSLRKNGLHRFALNVETTGR